MPITVLNDAAATTITGPVTIANDQRLQNAGALNVSGTVSVSGATTLAGALTLGSAVTASGTFTASSGEVVSNGLQYDFISGSNNAGLATTASSQSMSVSGSLITMTSGLAVGGPHVIYVSANSTSATCTLTPTSSASTSGIFQNGVEITVVNLGVSGSRIVIPTTGAGPLNHDTIVISAGHATRFVYNSALQEWLPIAV